MNKKEAKVIRLYEDGVEIKVIARRLGYTGNSMTAGIELVKQIIGKYKGNLL